MEYGFDYIDGVETPQMVITDDYTIQDEHRGTVHVEKGILTIRGVLQGTLDVQKGTSVVIIGKQHGTVSVNDNAKVTIMGELHGTTNVSDDGTVIVEKTGKLAGALHNNGTVIIRGVYGGSQSGSGELILEDNGYIKQPTIRNGVNYYEW